MRRLLLLCLFTFSTSMVALADKPAIVIDSEQADYDGNKLTLNGNVYVEHEIGEIGCNEAVLIPKVGRTPKQRFSFLRLKEAVKLHLWDGGLIKCARADIDYQSLTGTFSGSPQQEYVTYIDNFAEGDGERVSMVVKGQQMTIQLSDEQHLNETRFAYHLDNIIAEGKVTVDYDGAYIALADRVIYHLPKENDLTKADERLNGHVFLQPIGEEGICEISNLNGDRIRSKQMKIDCKNSQIHFEEPTGAVYVSSLTPSEVKGKAERRVDFSSKLMVWDDPSLKLTLYEDVQLHQEGFGKVEADERAQLVQRIVDGKKDLQYVSTTGRTKLKFVDKDQNAHFLVTYGGMTIDHVDLVATLTSPSFDGKVPLEQQVFFVDGLGEVFADSVQLHYALQGKQVVPQKLLLEGNVNLVNRNPGFQKTAEKKGVQYAIADRVVFFPQDHKMSLESTTERKVLLYDTQNKIQVSAPAIDMTRDGQTGKESFKGRGDVRFTFVAEELNRLKEAFSVDKLRDLGKKQKDS